MSEHKKPSFPVRNNASRPFRPTNAPMTARRAAYEALDEVLHKDAYASLAINAKFRDASLSQADKRLCTGIVYRTVENLTAIDHALSFYLKDPDSLDKRVRDILRIGACQYLFMDRIPENAIADESVKLTRQIGIETMTGLVNGVLRTMMREPEKIVWPDESDTVNFLSIRYSMPKWLTEHLIECYGTDMAKKMIMYRTQEHFMTLRPNMTRMTDDDFEKMLAKKVWTSEKGLVEHAWRVRGISSVSNDYQYRNGDFSIQGEASILCAQVAEVKRGMQVIDCCAAPGGKTAYMAEMLGGTGRVYAWDLHNHRVDLMRAAMQRLELDNVRCAVRDATKLKDDLIRTADVVLLDAPCSGLGVVDDKPDIKYHVTQDSVNALVKTQKQLLNTCSEYVKKGGTLVYSTCSVLPEENEKQIEEFLNTHPDFELVDLPDCVPEQFRHLQGAHGLQLIEARDGIEGFFIAKMKRIRG